MTRGKVFGWLLFASLGLNVFLLTDIVGSRLAANPATLEEVPQEKSDEREAEQGDAIRMPQRDRTPAGPGRQARRSRLPRPGPPTLSLHRNLVTALGGPEDPRVAELMGEMREARKLGHGKIREARSAVSQAITEEPFSGERLENALKELSEQTEGMRASAEANVVKLAQQLTPQERKELQRLEQSSLRDLDHPRPFPPHERATKP